MRIRLALILACHKEVPGNAANSWNGRMKWPFRPVCAQIPLAEHPEYFPAGPFPIPDSPENHAVP